MMDTHSHSNSPPSGKSAKAEKIKESVS